MKVVTLVPYRSDCGERDTLWLHCRARWTRDHPDWEIHMGHHHGGPFNRSAAINAAAEQAGEWDVAAIIDADIICDTGAVRRAAKLAHDSGRLVLGGQDRHMLSPEGTQKLLAGYEGPWEPLVEKIHPDETMCCAFVARRLWDRVGGFDPLFVGYGWEDLAFIIACETFSQATVTRLDAPVYHLHHTVSPENDKHLPEYQRNRTRYKRYHEAGGRPDAIDELLREAR